VTTTKLWTAQEAAEFLRMSVSWVYQAASRGELPSVRVGRALRFEAAALMLWVSRKTAPAKVVPINLQRGR
jgi:excisionase family DNA binding protein